MTRSRLPLRPVATAVAAVLGPAFCLAAGLMAGCAQAANVPAEVPADVPQASHEIMDLPFGNALFEFYQEHYFATLTDLMVSEHFNRVPHHTEESEILRGGILLSYGLHREAGELFERLIKDGAAPATRDRAWFYLAKIRYQRGYFPEAEQALQQIGNALPESLQEERSLLQANLLMERQDYADAVTVLQPLVNAKDATPSDYVTYNLGIALIKSGNNAGGSALLDKLGTTHEDDEEHRSLRDRANLALGFAALQAKQPADQYFERIRLKSAQANKALLGLGWSRVQTKDYKQALIPWQELAQRDDNDAPELEAKIAVPYAYAQLGAFGQAANLYNQAIQSFGTEAGALDESINAINAGKLVAALLADNPGQDMGWFWNIRDLPDMPHASHLAHVLAQHEFQEAFKNYRDLLFLNANLEQWRDKLGVFSQMLDNRRKAFAERVPRVAAQAGATSVDALSARQQQLAARSSQGQSEADGIAFADTQQADLLARVERAHQLIDQHPGEPEFTAAQRQVHLARGALLWQLTQDYPERSWHARQSLQEIAAQIDQAQQREAALLQAQVDEPLRFNELEQRIHTMAAQLDALLPRVAELKHQQQLAVQAIADAELSHEKELLGQYANQARFALAQLYDRGTEATTDDQKANAPTTGDGHAQP